MTASPSGPRSTAAVDPVGPLVRGISVLRRLADADGSLSLGELARRTGLARSTVDRMASTLERMGHLRLDGREAHLAPGLMRIGNAYLSAVRLPDLLGPHAERLADLLDESVSLAVPDRDGVRFVHQTTRRRALSLSFRIGDLLPAERTAAGAVFAADWTAEEWTRHREQQAAEASDGQPALPAAGPHDHAGFRQRADEAGTNGWSLDDQLIEPGLVALAAPVRDGSGHAVCAVSVVSHTSRRSAASLRHAALSRLGAAVTAMEQDLSRSPAPRRSTGDGLASWTAASKEQLGPDFVESLARGLTVLTAFGEGRAELSLSAVAEATGLPRATARRALLTLAHLGYVAVGGPAPRGVTFRPTPQVLALGFAPLSELTLPAIARPHLADLAAEVHESASLAVLAGDDIQYTARVATRRIMSVHITVGTRFPAHATSMGRVLLAGLPPQERSSRLAGAVLRPLTRHTTTSAAELSLLLDRVANEGHALVDQELEEGLRSVAVPVRDRTGLVVAAANVSMHAGSRTPAECRESLLPALRAAADRIEADLAVAGHHTRVAAH